MRKTRFFLTGVLVFFLFAATAQSTQIGDRAPDFTLTTLAGKTVSLQDLQGQKPVWLVFWATWCPHCKEEIQQINELYQELKGKVELVAINIGVNDSVRKVQRFRAKYGMDYPVAFDQGSVVTKQFKVMGTPTQIMIDINGIVRYRAAASPVDIGKHLDSLMGK